MCTEAQAGVTNELLDAVMRTADETPDAVAYHTHGVDDVSYASLWDGACRIAWALLDHVPNKAPVIVYSGKTPLAVMSFLGCLLAGHAFVPVDSELPVQRVHDIASQIEGAVLLACEDVPHELAHDLESGLVVDVRRVLDTSEHIRGRQSTPPRESWVKGEDTHYIIFTSGSTGRPKGIEVSAANVANFMRWLRGFPLVCDGGRTFLDQAHYSFDLSEYELVGSLATGGRLHAVSSEVAKDYRALFDELAASGVEIWVSTPSFADFCLVDKDFSRELLPELGMFLFCGEELHRTTAHELRRRFPKARIVNTYGPTESTVAVTYVELSDEELSGGEGALPVGRPREGTELRIVDPDTGRACPAGVSGEIVIVGDTVAKGYYENPEKTQEAFFQTELADGTPTRGYHTGDLGHVDEGGMLFCEGRFDSLVKLNGFRIELGEVEGCLAEAPGVAQAAVVPVRRDGRVRSLRAFVVLEERLVDGDFELARRLKGFLSSHLPSYMVPRSIKFVERMPLTANGKVDRKALQRT